MDRGVLGSLDPGSNFLGENKHKKETQGSDCQKKKIIVPHPLVTSGRALAI